MGNISSMARASTALDSYVSELGNDISYEKSLSSSRFLKTILARHKFGPLVIKIFIKPDASMTLRVIQRRLKSEREALAHIPSVHTYATFIETEKAGYLIRQWGGSSLYDRLSTQPYLTDIEKKWVAFQLLTCLRDARMRKVAHGDIKSDNVLITSDLTVLLTDFSSAFKPTYLPLDDPSDFSFFFDSSARRTCYIAPERFYEADSKIALDKASSASVPSSEGSTINAEPWEKRDGKVTEEMDVFSAGCVIAETWTDGRTVFNLSELFAYRNGTLGLEGILDNLEDNNVKDMIAQMLSREPGERPSFDRILANFRGTIFPEYFYTFLIEYVTELGELPDSPTDEFLNRASTLPGTKIDTMLEQWDSISVPLESKDTNDNGPALLLLNIVTSSIRNCLSPSSRLHGLKLFLKLCPYLMDEDKVDRVVPFVVELLSDEVAIVRAEACRTLVIVVESVASITPHNCTFIPEYLLPQTRRLANDTDVFVRATYARALVRLADEAVRMLELSEAANENHISEAEYNSMLAEIHSVVEEQATSLLVDSSSDVKRSLLASIQDLCLFFGRQKSSEVVLSHIMTYLNDRDWQLRLAFFDGIVDVGAFIGVKAVEEYVLPLMLQALADPEEVVVSRVIASLSSLTSLSLIPRMRLWDVFVAVQGFLYHPNSWIRQGTAGFVAATARRLSEADTWCILYPAVRQALRADVVSLDEDSILSALVSPLSRSTLEIAKTLALQNSPPGFWNIGPARTTAKSALTKTAPKPSHDLQHLKDKPISSKDEKKIVAMREFIVKQAQASRAREGFEMPNQAEEALTSGKSISLINLGVTPQTVFLSPRTIGVTDAKMGLRRLRPDLADTPSRRASFASRSARGTDSPADELLRRLAALETTRRTSLDQVPGADQPRPPSPTGSALSSTFDPRSKGHHRIDSKSSPLIGAVHATAHGTTSTHEGTSGRSTPVPAAGATPQVTMGPLAPYSSTYEGADPGVRAFLEQVDLENYREPLLDLGPRVHANHRKRGPRPKASTPQYVTMIAHFPHHTGAVTAIVPSPDHLFFATSSEDKTIHIWDNARLERSVSGKPRLTYRMDAPIGAMCRIEETHCFAAAAEDGSLHIIRVYVSTGGSSSNRYKGIERIRTWRCAQEDGHVVHVTHLQDSSLLVVTSAGMIGTLDMRGMELKRRLQHPLELGPISAVCPTTHWVVIGTVTGSLSLWDLRFGLLLKSWAARGGITSLGIHPARGRGRWIMAGITRDAESGEGAESDDPLVETYDIETSKLVEVYETRTTRPGNRAPPPGRDVLKNPTDLIAELAGGRGVPDSAVPSVQSLLVGASFASLAPPRVDASALKPGWLITAGDDRVIRYWDLVKASDSFVLCGSQREKDVAFKLAKATPNIFYTLPNARTQDRTQAAARQPLRPHYDAICALSVVETPFSSCVVSADRSGVIKVWRMEGAGSRP